MSFVDGFRQTTPYGLIRELRPWQWYKQVVLFIPVVFSQSALEVSAWLLTVPGAALFSFVAGSVYLVNDVLDREEDRQHPEKQHRPVASGLVSVPLAVGVAAVLFIGSVGVAALINPLFAACLLLYVGQNVLYSAKLKEFRYVDVSVIAIGFVLRAIAGVLLLNSPMSPWLLLCTYLAALMLATGQRIGEAQATDTSARESLSKYTMSNLDFMFTTVSTMVLAAYVLYTFSARTDAMMATIPFAFYAVFRYHGRVEAGDGENPEAILTDLAMLSNLACWGGVVFVTLYLLPEIGVFP